MVSSSESQRFRADMALDTDATETPGVSAAPLVLGDLAIGESARVHRLAMDRPIARRLMELGLLPGTMVEVVRSAPLGDPIELSIRGYRLSIRKSEATRVEVVQRRARAESR